MVGQRPARQRTQPALRARIRGRSAEGLGPPRCSKVAAMGHRLSKIATRTGDDGTTGLGDGSRVSKDTLRVEAMGSVDELNCALGVLLSSGLSVAGAEDCLIEIQHDLFDLGGELAIPGTLLVEP